MPSGIGILVHLFGVVTALVCHRFSLSPFWSVAVLELLRFGCCRFGCHSFGFVTGLTCIHVVDTHDHDLMSTEPRYILNNVSTLDLSSLDALIMLMLHFV